ncbi:MAG: RagB/SusD family nutrient uptake outer membrane protein [Ekhidna sp.]|nr:RagB/SusD family nutrient uptake outer membrane protein [Ekhidna sp.]MBC6410029.1 RagB/SusD family nutrient uptake outer membrane protein [Ekhidna sp.]
MKKYLNYLVGVFCFCGCGDFLDQEPGAQVSIDEQLSTRIGVEQSIAGVYRDVEELLSERYCLYADLQGGNLTFTPRTREEVTVPLLIAKSYDFADTEQNSDYAGLYEGLYTIIAQVNIMLERIDLFTFFEDAELRQMQSELLAIRAFSHYLAAIHYAQHYSYTADASHPGIVYNTQTLQLGVDFPARLTLFETYQYLKADLKAALSLQTDASFLSGGSSYAYFNRITIQGLYARMALQMNDWEQALFYANEVISTSGISLTTNENYITEWKWDERAVSEVILEFAAPRNSDGEVSSSKSTHFIYNSLSSYSHYATSGDLLDLYEETDIRSGIFLEVDLPTAAGQEKVELPYFFTWKFQGNTGTINMRLSEMYLIRSEANARLNNISEALADLNIIRERAGLAALVDTSELLEEIFLERRRELAFEGHLLFDIVRFAKDVSRNQGCLSRQCNLNYPSPYFILPIPFSSTGLNDNIIQNKGY